MSAIVGILNKRAVAVAADSAMTVSENGTTKIYNNAQKIFNISPEIPVSIMICGGMDFMNIPWDVIVNLYRDYRKGKPLDTLQDYTNDFIEFIKGCKYLQNTDICKDFLLSELGSFYYRIQEDVEKRAKEEPDKEALELYLDILRESVDMYRKSGIATEMKRFSFHRFCKITAETFDSLINTIRDDKCPLILLDEWRKGFYEYMRSQCFLQHSEIIITGYGDKQIFPQIQSLLIAGIIDGRLRYRYDTNERIDIGNTAIITPFAQSDVMLTLLKGIAPDLYQHMMEKQAACVEKARTAITERLIAEGVSDDVIDRVRNIAFDELNQQFCDSTLDFISEKHTDGIISAVDNFCPDEMADMAGNLISITGLQQHFSSSQESVGGAVNVAIITKTGGFRWVKDVGE